MTKRIVLMGATGLIGKNFLGKLIEDPEVKSIEIIGRRTSGNDHPKIKEYIKSLLTEEFIKSVKPEGDIYFCTLGTTIKKAGSKDAFRKIDYDFVMAFGELAKERSAQSFYVVSALGANPKSHFFYNKVKGEMEQGLENLALHSLTILSPSLLIGRREEYRLLESISIKVFKLISTFLPESIAVKLGTDVEKICLWVMNDLNSLSRGIRRIRRFSIPCTES